MKATLYKNIDLVRINVKSGILEYYLPQNVAWAKSKIDKIVCCVPTNACYDPMDGVTPVMNIAGYKDLYFNIYTADQREIMHSVSAEQLMHRNNNVIEINDVLDLSLCNIFFSDDPGSDFTLLLYVFHDSKTVEDYIMPENSVTMEFALSAGAEINLQDIITTYIHALPAKVRGIMVWSAINSPAYITLRDYKETYVLRDIHTEMMRPIMNGGSAYDTQAAPVLFDNIDIDFQYSHIRNATPSTNMQKITLLY